MKKSLLTLALAASFSLSGCSSLIYTEKPDSEMTVDEFYTEASDAFKDKQWDTAINYYEKLKAYYPYGGHAEQSYLELAYAYYRYDEPESAIRELDEFIKVYPQHEQLAYAYYLRALAADSVTTSWLDKFITDPAQRDTKSTQRTFDYYEAVVANFPESIYAPQSAQRLVILQNRMARREFQVAKFYFDRKAYLAAANRGQTIIKEYPRAIINMDVLEMMKDSYTILGMEQNLADTQRVIDYNLDLIAEREQKEAAARAKDSSWLDKIGDTFMGIIE